MPLELGDLVNKILTCQAGKATQTHLKVLRLNLIKPKRSFMRFCLSVILRAADDVDNRRCYQLRSEGLQNMGALLGPYQVKLSTTAYDINLVIGQ